MNIAFKIRIAFLLLGLCFAGAAILVRPTSLDKVLEKEAKLLAMKLHEKENFVETFLSQKKNIAALKNINKNPTLALDIIKQWKKKPGLYVFTYRDSLLSFWSTSAVAAERNSLIPEGSSLQVINGKHFEVIKKTEERFSVAFYLPLEPCFSSQRAINHLTWANNQDKQVYHIHRINGKYLLSVKLVSRNLSAYQTVLEWNLWVFALVFFTAFMTCIGVYAVSKAHVKTAIGTLFLFFLVAKLVCSWYVKSPAEAFSCGNKFSYYTEQLLYPSMSDLFLQALLLTWLLTFIYCYRYQIKFLDKEPKRLVTYCLLIALTFPVILVIFEINRVFHQLVLYSKINFDIANVLNLDYSSWLSLLLLCFYALNLYLAIEITVSVAEPLRLNRKQHLTILLIITLAIWIAKQSDKDIDYSVLLLGLVIYPRGWLVNKDKREFDLGVFAFTLLVFSTVAFLHLYHVQLKREHRNREAIASAAGSLNDYLSQHRQNPQEWPSDLHEVLLNGKNSSLPKEIRKYSFAYYKDGYLIDRYGKYAYNTNNKDFHGKLRSFMHISKNGYDHLFYQHNEHEVLVVSKPEDNWFNRLAAISFLFLIFLFFALIIAALSWPLEKLIEHNASLGNIPWGYFLFPKHWLYKTRIQTSMVMAVVTTLMFIGIATYLSIRLQYQNQQEKLIIERINNIANELEKDMYVNKLSMINEKKLNAYAHVNAVDLAYYNTNGKLAVSTQAKIQGFSRPPLLMSPLAYFYLNHYQRPVYLHKAQKGKIYHIAVYIPLRGNKQGAFKTVAYLCLPYYCAFPALGDHLGEFLNTLVNVFALVFVSISFFVVVMAKRITFPLTLVQKSLSQTKLGQKNEPIIWDKDDEIGALIKEYNHMIIKLEEYTQQLARSEREIAWKEMAKQVAHEIKNPLTPLKLGMQLLEKSWKEKDPNFETKLQRFSKSFVEQIENLSRIASEFSNFAKTPETSFECTDIREVIERSVEPYIQSCPQVKIRIVEENLGPNRFVKASKDQLLYCLNNLVKNAIEAIPPEVQGEINISLEQNDRKILIKISDNGRGISEDLKGWVFNPNFTTKVSGTGLGLYFTKQAIENMMGSIYLETEVNVGTTFFMTLPLFDVNRT